MSDAMERLATGEYAIAVESEEGSGMSDDLVKRLRDVAEATGPNEARQIALAAADRIEELEIECNKAALWAREQHASADRYAARIEELEAKLAQQDDLVQAAVAAERERCAKVAESVALPMDGKVAKAQAGYMRGIIAHYIREGGE